MKIRFDATKPARTAFALILLLGLGACQESVEVRQEAPRQESDRPYRGTVRDDQVQRYMNEVWSKLRGNDRCGACHVPGGSAPTPFVHPTDVNAAHDEALKIVDTETPENSLMVTKVAGGHQCWLGASEGEACAAQLVVYLRNWLYPTDTLVREEVDLKAPPMRQPDTSAIAFPATSDAFRATVWPELVRYCADCHADNAAIPQAPFFAQPDVADIDEAYEAAKPKIDLNNPANSRIVVRLRDEFHNCWSDCASDAADLERVVDALARSAALEAAPSIDLDTVPNSMAVHIFDGVVASGGGRYDKNVVALYKFDDGEGDTLIDDSSGVGAAADLRLYGTEGIDYRWLGGWGIEFLTPRGRAQADPLASAKLYDAITAAGEYSVEAWLIPGNVTQGADAPSAIVSYSDGTDNQRNFGLRQRLYNYDFLARSSASDGNGEPMLSSADADEVAATTLQHVVATFDPVEGKRLYVNGDLVASQSAGGANLGDWDDSFTLILGNEAHGNSPWAGSIRFLAIHSRALTPEQVNQNFDAGVGERYYLLFNIDDELAASGLALQEAYILLEVTRFDTYSYLVNRPTFISLDEAFDPATDLPAGGLRIAGLRIGLNGKEPEIGQPYVNLDVQVSAGEYGPRGQRLSEIGAIIALENGPERDQFFLTFEHLNGLEDSRVPGSWDQTFPPFSGTAAADIGLRTFDEINATMARLTGVNPTLDAIGGPDGTYTLVRQQLPASVNLGGFVSAHQVGVAQLAIEYCHQMVEDDALRTALFPAFDFGADARAVSTAQWQAGVIDPLIDRFVGDNLTSQPDRAALRDVLGNLIHSSPDGLALCGGASCEADRTRTVVKASCAALLGSAVTLVQ